MSMIALQGAVELGLIYSLVALGIFISYRILNIADLTVDGAFTLGAAVSAVMTAAGHPLAGALLALVAGALAGLATALLQTKLKVQPILAGIITMTALYSINLMVMGGKSNIPLLKKETLFTLASRFLPEGFYKLALTLGVAAVVSVALAVFLRTQLGLSIRATGDNRDMVSSSSINPAFTTTVGICISNAIVALGGALLAQYQMFSEITLGTGMVVIGLASLIIGEVIIGTRTIPRSILAAVVGAILYRVIIALALRASVSSSNLKLVSAAIVAAAISYPAIKEHWEFRKLRKAGERDADTVQHS